MSPGDYQLDPFEERGTVDLVDELELSEVRSRRRPWIAALLVLLALAAGWGIWSYTRDRPEKSPPPVAAGSAAQEPAVEPVVQEVVDLPGLQESDDWLRDVVGQLSAHPQLATWLLNEDLIRRFVAATVNLAEGASPRTHIRFAQPAGEFAVVERGRRLYVDPATYDRYDTLVGVLTSLHVDGTAQVYRNVKPLLDEAYQDLGYPGGDFDGVAARAVKVLLATPVVSDVEIEDFMSSYKYADSRLEDLTAAQKHFLRLGPDNLRAVQNHVRRVALRAGLVLD